MTRDEKTIAKLKEYCKELKNQMKVKWFSPESKLGKLESELASIESEEEKPIEQPSAPVSSDILDLMQYVTNLLYAAYDERSSLSSEKFDNWVDEQIFHIREYESQFTHQRQVSDEIINQVACDEMQQDWNDLRFQSVYKDGFTAGAKWMRYQMTIKSK